MSGTTEFGMSKRQIRREYRAFSNHYRIWVGLVILARVRIRHWIEASTEVGIDNRPTDQQIDMMFDRVASTYMPDGAKARMAWDVPVEIYAYLWGPLELAFCSFQAMLERYEALKQSYPDIAFDCLENYIGSNPEVLDAVGNLRDWVTHPSFAPLSDEGMLGFIHEFEDRGENHPFEVVERMNETYRMFIERLGASIG